MSLKGQQDTSREGITNDPNHSQDITQTHPLLHFLNALLWSGIIDTNRGNKKKTRGLRNVGSVDQQSSE